MPFGTEQAPVVQQQPAPDPNAVGPAPQAPADFVKALAAAAAANARAQRPGQRGLFNFFTGRDADAAAQSATINAPAVYDALSQGRTTTQSGQLGLAQTFQLLRNLGINVNPNNIPASYGNGQPAPSGQAPNAPQAQQAGGPQANVTPANDIAGRRAMFLRLGKAMSMLPAYAQQGGAFMKAAQDGLPDNTLPLSNGGVGDAVTGQPINMGAQEYNARGAGLKSAAQEAPRVAGSMAIENNRARNQWSLDTHQAEVGAQNRVQTGYDATTGLPTTTTDYTIAHGEAPKFIKDNPYFAGQQAELKDLHTSAESADNGLNLASQLVSAANGLYTGKGSASFQSARKLAQAAASLTGTKLPDSLNNDTSKFEQLAFASQQLVAAASHDLSPRVAQQIYEQIAAVKPGDRSSIKGLRDIITNQIVPTLARRKAMYGATSNFYRQNPLRNDAGAVLSDQMPLSNFNVKTNLSDVKPGEYFIDPQSGNLRQRPVH